MTFLPRSTLCPCLSLSFTTFERVIELAGESSTTELETEATTETTARATARAAPSVNQAKLPQVKTLFDSVVNPLGTQYQSGNPYI